MSTVNAIYHIVINYIKGQREHHHGTSFEQELMTLMEHEGKEWKDNLLT